MIYLRDGLIRDIENTPEIRRVKAVFEPLTDTNFNVRLEVFLDFSPPTAQSSVIPDLKLSKVAFDSPSAQAFVKNFVGSGMLIGEGGAGRVYINEKYPGIVVKTTKQVSVCRGFGTEFQTTKAMQQSLTLRLDNVRMINPIQKVDLDEEFMGFDCALILERVYRPKNVPFQTNGNEFLTLQAYVGSTDLPDLVQVIKSRGVYLGPNVVEKILGPLIPLVRDMAAFIADLQYNAGYDGLDMEYIIGYTEGNPKPQIYVIDFDQVTRVSDYDDYRKLEWPLSAEPYFPTEGPLFQHFADEYIRVATRAGHAEVAKTVVEQMASV